ncbi:MAG: AAA family ATPase [Planctomycetota bacterium]|nr:AAA family ATPase [Planctomycetota bacterium]
MAANDIRQRQFDLEILIRSRYPVIYVVTWEEGRVVEAAAEIGARLGKKVYTWTCLNGLAGHGPAGQNQPKPGNSASRDPLAALREVMDFKESALFIFKDFHAFLSRNNVTVIRGLREIARDFTTSFKTIILTGPILNLPPDLEKDVTVLDFPLPGPAELDTLLERAARELAANPKLKLDLSGDSREEILKAVQGLTLAEAESVFAKALVLHGRLGVEQIPDILAEKRQIIRKSGMLDFYDSDASLAEVGGLENLKNWLVKRKLAFSDKAGGFGLPPPRGVLLLGVQGCGKSLCAKAVSALWKLPLLRLDIGRIFNSLVGGSEENIRRAISVAEGVAPCILWVDEIDKAFGGLSGSSTDSGTSQRVLGSFLTWLAEKRSSVFVAATANNVTNLPPELLRKGRFDEIFFVDLPNSRERESIVSIHLRRRRRSPENFDLAGLAGAAAGFSGAEMEQAVISGLFDAFYDGGREVTTTDILRALVETVPLSRTMAEEIERLRNWCQTRARPATAAERENVSASRLADLPCVEGEPL